MNNIFKKEKGFTLLEMLISIMVITIGVLGIYSAVFKYIKNTQQERENLVASYLCQEGIEIVKNIRDTNWVESATTWSDGLTSCSSGCEADYNGILTAWSSPGRYLYIDNSTGLYKYVASPVTGDIKTSYTRKIDIVPNGTDELDITVYVYWETNTIVVKENLFNWR